MFTAGGIVRACNVYVLRKALEVYLASGGRLVAEWGGRAATHFHLESEIPGRGDAFINLLRGYDPTGTRAVVQNPGASNRQAATQWVFSVPKDLDVLTSQAPPNMSRAVWECVRDAVRATLAHMEAELACTRRGHGGTRREPVSLVWTLWPHETARPVEPGATPDPCTHFHVLIISVGQRRDGSFGTVESRPFYVHQKQISAFFHLELATRLERQFGLTVDAEHIGWGIRGIPRRARDQFSRRRLEQILPELGRSAAHSVAAANAAASFTRELKEPALTARDRRDWQRQGRAAGFGPDQARALLDHGRHHPCRHPDPDTAARAICDAALLGVTSELSHFTEQQFTTYAATLGPGTGLDLAGLLTRCRAFLTDSPAVVRLQHEGERHYTSRHLWRVEDQILTWAQESSSTHHADAAAPWVRRAARQRGLSREQCQALEHVTQSGSIAIVEGYAGTGKTAALAAYVDGQRKVGNITVGLAVAAKAAEGLRSATGVDFASSIARWQLHAERDPTEPTSRQRRRAQWRYATWRISKEERDARIQQRSRVHDVLARAAGFMSPREFQYREHLREHLRQHNLTPRHTVIVDEASMVDTPTMSILMQATRAAGARLVLVGDTRQLPAIHCGGVFARLARELGSAKLSAIRRQHAPWMRTASRHAAHGEAAKVLTAFARRGRLHIAPTRDAAKQALVAHWKEQGGAARPSAHLLICATRTDCEDINRLAQEARRSYLGRRAVSVDSRRRFHVGDRIMVTKNARRLGVYNGDMGMVTAVNLRRHLTVRLDTGAHVIIPTRKFTSLELGYCGTTHKFQGATTERVSVLVGGRTQSRQLSYVQVSRSRHETWLFTDRYEAGPRLTELTKQFALDRAKHLAHDLRGHDQERGRVQ